MSSDQPDYYKWLQDLTAQSVAEQTHAMRRYNELIQRLLNGEFNDPHVREEYQRFASEEAARYARDLAQLSLTFYTALLDLGRSYNERFFEQVLHSREDEAHPGNGSDAADRPRQVVLDLHGAAGQEATASFVIENKHNTRADISFVVSDFVDAAGGGPFRPPLELQPPALDLGPREEAGVKMRLPLPRAQFAPGHRYRAKVFVRGYDDLELILSVMIDPAEEPEPPVSTAAPPPPAPPEAKRARGRRSASAAKKATETRTQKPAGSRSRRSRAEGTD